MQRQPDTLRWPEAHRIARQYQRLSGSGRGVPTHILWRLTCRRCDTDMSAPSVDALCDGCRGHPLAHEPGS